MLLAITYGDDNFSQSNKYNLYTAVKYGKADKVILYGPNDLDEDFKKENYTIIQAKRGAGYWIWKPYTINKALKSINYGDYLVYADSGSFYVDDINILIRFINEKNADVFIGKLDHKESEYSKRDAFVYLDVDTREMANSYQYEASFILLKKTVKTERLMKEWLEYCTDIRIISNNENTCGKDNYPEFVENRFDQTVLSLLAKKHGIVGYRPADTVRSKQFRESNYKQIIVRTRFRNCNQVKFTIKIIFKWIQYYIYNFRQ